MSTRALGLCSALLLSTLWRFAVYEAKHTWALVLAAGDGSRLHSLTTTTAGVAVPKQFCSLRGGPSLLHEALWRARAVATPQHTCVIVARQHGAWWKRPLGHLPEANVIVQWKNRGTGNGILLPLLHIAKRDPEAVVLLLPSDHHVEDERTLRRSLRESIAQVRLRPDSVLLLGLEPDELDCELGYIVPGEADGEVRCVERFVEKPSVELARTLLKRDALWNAFIVVAHARTLIDLFAASHPQATADMQRAVDRDMAGATGASETQKLYDRLPTIDFSRDVLQEFPERLRVLSVPACGWSDLGTPARVARTLSCAPAEGRRAMEGLTGDEGDETFAPFAGVLNLAERHTALRASG